MKDKNSIEKKGFLNIKNFYYILKILNKRKAVGSLIVIFMLTPLIYSSITFFSNDFASYSIYSKLDYFNPHIHVNFSDNSSINNQYYSALQKNRDIIDFDAIISSSNNLRFLLENQIKSNNVSAITWDTNKTSDISQFSNYSFFSNINTIDTINDMTSNFQSKFNATQINDILNILKSSVDRLFIGSNIAELYNISNYNNISLSIPSTATLYLLPEGADYTEFQSFTTEFFINTTIQVEVIPENELLELKYFFRGDLYWKNQDSIFLANPKFFDNLIDNIKSITQSLTSSLEDRCSQQYKDFSGVDVFNDYISPDIFYGISKKYMGFFNDNFFLNKNPRELEVSLSNLDSEFRTLFKGSVYLLYPEYLTFSDRFTEIQFNILELTFPILSLSIFIAYRSLKRFGNKSKKEISILESKGFPKRAVLIGFLLQGFIVSTISYIISTVLGVFLYKLLKMFYFQFSISYFTNNEPFKGMFQFLSPSSLWINYGLTLILGLFLFYLALKSQFKDSLHGRIKDYKQENEFRASQKKVSKQVKSGQTKLIIFEFLLIISIFVVIIIFNLIKKNHIDFEFNEIFNQNIFLLLSLFIFVAYGCFHMLFRLSIKLIRKIRISFLKSPWRYSLKKFSLYSKANRNSIGSIFIIISFCSMTFSSYGHLIQMNKNLDYINGIGINKVAYSFPEKSIEKSAILKIQNDLEKNFSINQVDIGLKIHEAAFVVDNIVDFYLKLKMKNNFNFESLDLVGFDLNSDLHFYEHSIVNPFVLGRYDLENLKNTNNGIIIPKEMADNGFHKGDIIPIKIFSNLTSFWEQEFEIVGIYETIPIFSRLYNTNTLFFNLNDTSTYGCEGFSLVYQNNNAITSQYNNTEICAKISSEMANKSQLNPFSNLTFNTHFFIYNDYKGFKMLLEFPLILSIIALLFMSFPILKDFCSNASEFNLLFHIKGFSRKKIQKAFIYDYGIILLYIIFSGLLGFLMGILWLICLTFIYAFKDLFKITFGIIQFNEIPWVSVVLIFIFISSIFFLITNNEIKKIMRKLK